ncbi:apoptosis-inducing factor 3-like isoform X2 [Lycorma delicatula]|uniref:apoptosis-inducing factor 3-like isoform X2 n=1 Tax=Lycorma delicatula TaxID=130591 RepID=UPI003F51816A
MRWWSVNHFLKKYKGLFTQRFSKMSGEITKTPEVGATHSDISGSKSDVVEAVVCQNSDLKENEMKVFELGKTGLHVLVIKQNGKVYATGNKCTHYGAPLVSGALGKGRVRCPWHGACFNIVTGDIEDFPGLDSIPRYNCDVIAGGGIKVTVLKSQLKENKRCRLTMMPTRVPSLNVTYVVVGGGAAGNNCAETLRTEGFQGQIIMISDDKYLPYDRIKLSKVLNVDHEKIALRTSQFYKDADISVILDVRVTKLKADNRILCLSNGSELEYNKLFIATGGRGRRIKMHGSDLENIFSLRTIDDGKKIYGALSKDANLVIIGSSFIGMEVASYAMGKVKSVTVVSRSKVPFDVQLGEVIGVRILQLFKEKGIAFVLKTGVEKYVGNNGVVSEVHLKNGTVLPADVVVVGIGVDYNTEFLAGSEVIMRMDGTIPVDRFLETNVKGIYAGGDIAYAPVFANNDKQASIGHWQLAHYHGYIAALNMAGKVKPLQTVPFFWTVLFGLSFRYAGVAGEYDGIVIQGSLEDLKFAAYYCENDKVNAILTAGFDPLAAKFAEILANGKNLKKSDVTKEKIVWPDKLPTYFGV